MADDIEAELEEQLTSQREALHGINEALDMLGDGAPGQEGHAELLQMREELRAAVSELESALLEIKRSRILAQLSASVAPPPAPGTTTPDNPQPLRPPQPQPQPEVAAAVLPAVASEPSAPSSGSPCHFRYMDGRWYPGRVQGPGRQAGTLAVVFEVPTRPFMLDTVDIMEALVRRCEGAMPTSAAATTAAGPSCRVGAAPQHQQQQRQQRQQQLGSPQHQGAPGAAVAVGRRALALLPGSRLYRPVEVVAVDAVRATATVLPLLPQSNDGRGGGGRGGGGGGGEVVVPLGLVTRHAHVPSGAGAGAGGGDVESEGDGGGSDSSAGSVRALLRPAMGEEGEEGDGDFESGDDDGDDDDDDDDDGGEGEDMDLYGTDDDAGDGHAGGRGGVGGGRRGAPLSAAAAAAASMGRRNRGTGVVGGDDGGEGDDDGGGGLHTC